MKVQADITTFFTDKGNQFYVEGTSWPLWSLLDDLSISIVRLAVFSLEEQLYDYAEALKEIKAAGKKLYLDIHCSDYWADPSHQRIPITWDFKDINSLRSCFFKYICDICTLVYNSGVEVAYVQVGNEITNGMLWPYLNDLTECSRFLKIAISYIRDSFPGSKIVVHTDLSGFPDKAVQWYQAINSKGVFYDIVGLSYYPVWHGTLETLKKTINRVHFSCQKPVILCEIGYMSTTQKTKAWFGTWQCGSIDYTPQGQSDYLEYLVAQLAGYKEYIIPEMYYWGGFSYVSKEHFPVALFDNNGNALPAIKTIKRINLNQ